MLMVVPEKKNNHKIISLFNIYDVIPRNCCVRLFLLINVQTKFHYYHKSSILIALEKCFKTYPQRFMRSVEESAWGKIIFLNSNTPEITLVNSIIPLDGIVYKKVHSAFSQQPINGRPIKACREKECYINK